MFGDARPDAWVVGDGPVDAPVLAAEACGLRVSRTLSLAEAAAAIAERRRVPLVLVDVGGMVSDDTADLLDQLDHQARDSRTALVVSCTMSALDAVAARITAPYATLLCDPAPADWALAVCAVSPAFTGVAETGQGADVQQLLRLTEEVTRVARVLAGLAPDASGRAGIVSDSATGYRARPATPPVAASDIRAIIRWRRRRDALLPGDHFADPVWDMILDLAAAQIEGVDVAISSLCIAAAVPPTTALRAITTLTDAGVFLRAADPRDGRRIHIRLADVVASRVLAFLAEAKGAGVLLL